MSGTEPETIAAGVLDRASDPDQFRLHVAHGLTVGPPGNVFLFGGAAMAAAVEAAEKVVGRPLVSASIQFLSFARAGDDLDLSVGVVPGRSVSQAAVTAEIDGRPIFSAFAALGDRGDRFRHQWHLRPDLPPPDSCVRWPLWPPQGGGLIERFEVLVPPKSPGTRGLDGRIEPGGRLTFWIRPCDARIVDAVLLAIVADFAPAGVASALGRPGGGNSLDNSLRIAGVVPTSWMMCDVQVDWAGRGFAHVGCRIFAQDGTLMAIGSQSLALRSF